MNFDLHQSAYIEHIRTDKYRYIAVDLEEKKVLLLEGPGFQQANMVKELTGDEPELPAFWQMYVKNAYKRMNDERLSRMDAI